MSKESLRVLIDNDHVKISYRPGYGERCVVCCTSVGNLPTRPGGTDGQNEEFVGTLSGRREHLMFLTDKMRSWYSDPSIVSVMTDSVRSYARRTAVERFSTLGVSMGGAGALLLGEALGADRVLAFNPQSSMSDELKYDDTFDDYLVNLKPGFEFEDCCRAESMKRRALIVTSDYQDNDVFHGQRFFEHGFRPIVLKNCEHNSPGKLKSLGLLKPFVNAVLDGAGHEVIGTVLSSVPGKNTFGHGQEALCSFYGAHALYMESKKKEEDVHAAYALALRAVRKDQSVGKFHLHLGNLLVGMGRLSEAEKNYKTALELDPLRPIYHLSLSRIYIKQGCVMEALFHGRAALRHAKRSKVLFLENYALVLLKSGDPSEAERFQVKALMQEPRDPSVRIHYAEILQSRGRIGAAAAEVGRAIRLKGDEPDYYNYYGALLLEMNNVSGAEKAVRIALSMNPEKGLYHALLSRIHHRSGLIEKSVAAIEQAIRLDGTNPNYFFHLGMLLITAGDMPGALKAYRMTVELAPDEPVFQAWLNVAEKTTASLASGYPQSVMRTTSSIAGAPI